jgi:hypothetical protein
MFVRAGLRTTSELPAEHVFHAFAVRFHCGGPLNGKSIPSRSSGASGQISLSKVHKQVSREILPSAGFM